MRAPVGIFDSGLGGLCAVRELRALAPEEDIVYFGDTARLPYGTRSFEAVCRYAAQDAAFLLKQNVKAILIACGTVSSIALPTLLKTMTVPLLGIVEPAAKAALAVTQTRKIAVLGTPATIASGSYEKVLRFLSGGNVSVTSAPCPLLVPLAENGQTDTDVARLAIKQYLTEPLNAGCDTILLGCTHYPLFSDLFRELAPGAQLIDAGKAGAAAMAALLHDKNLSGGGTGSLSLYTSDFSQGFEQQASRFLQDDTVTFMKEKVAIETWE